MLNHITAKTMGAPVYTHILIPTDGSDLAQNGVDHGLALAKALGSKVTLITVTEPFLAVAGSTSAGSWTPTQDDVERYDSYQREFARDLLASSEAVAKKMGLDVTTRHVSDSSPASAIVSSAKELGCSLIVMASHGRRGITRLLLGSQTSEVVATAPVPVLVIR